MKTYSLKRLNTKHDFLVNYADNKLKVLGPHTTTTFFLKNIENKISIEADLKEIDQETLEVAMEAAFNTSFEACELILNNQDSILRADFFERQNIWNVSTRLDNVEYVQSGSVTHPVRPQVEAGKILYSRYVEAINASVQFRVIDPVVDLDVFHQWHNQPRVAEFWEMPFSKEELLAYINKSLSDSHQLPVIAEINGVPAGYFEIYWTKEDRLGPYYDSANYDRGFHLLVGNTDFLGFKNTDALLKSATHFIFLDDERSTKIMGEPRYDNEKILKYVLSFKSWRKIKEFDFPHKRAALLECDRNLFFKGHYL